MSFKSFVVLAAIAVVAMVFLVPLSSRWGVVKVRPERHDEEHASSRAPSSSDPREPRPDAAASVRVPCTAEAPLPAAALGVGKATDTLPTARVQPALPWRADERVLEFYLSLLESIERLEQQKADPAFHWGPTSADSLLVSKIVRQLTEGQRFWYLGPKESMPLYSNRDMTNSRFHATEVGGLSIVFEMTSWEFPEVFESRAARLASLRK